MIAHDLDASSNARLTYRLASAQYHLQAFRIDINSGFVRVNADLTELNVEEELTLDVTVTDGGLPPFSDTARLVIVIVTKDLPGLTSSDGVSALLASEDLAVVLALTLATILVSIGVVVFVIFLARKKRQSKLLQQQLANEAVVSMTATGPQVDWFNTTDTADVQIRETDFNRQYTRLGGVASRTRECGGGETPCGVRVNGETGAGVGINVGCHQTHQDREGGDRRRTLNNKTTTAHHQKCEQEVTTLDSYCVNRVWIQIVTG